MERREPFARSFVACPQTPWHVVHVRLADDARYHVRNVHRSGFGILQTCFCTTLEIFMRTFKRTIIILAAVLWGLLPQPVLRAADPDDSPAQEPAPTPAPPAAQPAEQPESTQPEAPTPPEPAHPKKLPKHRGHRGPHIQRDAIVEFGKDVELKSGDSADAVVVIGGS